MSAIGSTSGSRKVPQLREPALQLREPGPALVSTPDKDDDRDVTMRDPVNIIIIYSAKVNTLPKFRGGV